MKIKALAQRILKQLSHDKRTLALMIIAPLFLLTLIFFIFEGTNSEIKIGVINTPGNFKEILSESDSIELIEFSSVEKAVDEMRDSEIVAFVFFPDGNEDIPVGLEAMTTSKEISVEIMIDGTSGSKGETALRIIEMAKLNIVGELPLDYDINYLDDIEEISMFDEFGSTLIGFLVFFFVFLVGGMAFLKERKSGTLERLLSTPIKRCEIIFGYIAGYGMVTVIQSVLISFYAVYVLGVMMEGSMWYVLLVTFLSAFCALTLGMLLSTTAGSEFQVMQFVPLVVLPQLFFCGLFDLSAGWMTFGKIFPLYYITDALNGIMFRAEGIGEIWVDLLILAGYCILFMGINILLLKKYRRI